MQAIQTTEALPSYPGMIRISNEAFSATVKQLNVHYTPTGRWSNVYGYKGEWKMAHSGQLVGACDNGGGGRPGAGGKVRRFVTESFYNQNRSTIEAIDAPAPQPGYAGPAPEGVDETAWLARNNID